MAFINPRVPPPGMRPVAQAPSAVPPRPGGIGGPPYLSPHLAGQLPLTGSSAPGGIAPAPQRHAAQIASGRAPTSGPTPPGLPDLVRRIYGG